MPQSLARGVSVSRFVSILTQSEPAEEFREPYSKPNGEVGG